MAISLACKACGDTLEAETEDALLAVAQAHADEHAKSHGVPAHRLTAEHLRRRLAHGNH